MVDLNNFLEYDIIIWLVNNDEPVQHKWSDLEEDETPSASNKEEKITKYSFDATLITAYRETFVKYKDRWLPAVVCCLDPEYFETPPLLVEYNKFKEDLKELKEKLDGDNQKETKATEGRIQ
jgi:hypothetical protein